MFSESQTLDLQTISCFTLNNSVEDEKYEVSVNFILYFNRMYITRQSCPSPLLTQHRQNSQQ